MSEDKEQKSYRGRIAPTPSGYLHEGHASTFKTAWRRARERDGCVIYRNDDLDKMRCSEEFSRAAMDDLEGLKINWDEPSSDIKSLPTGSKKQLPGMPFA